MNTLSYKTQSANKASVNKKWILIDAKDEILGRLSSKVAKIIRGKHKPNFTPHADCGDYVVIINAEKIRLTGNKMQTKEYMRYTGYPGGQRIRSIQDQLAKHPTRIIESAVRGMLPKNKLGRKLFKNMYVFAGESHNKEAQKPELLNINEFN